MIVKTLNTTLDKIGLQKTAILKTDKHSSFAILSVKSTLNKYNLKENTRECSRLRVYCGPDRSIKPQTGFSQGTSGGVCSKASDVYEMSLELSDFLSLNTT